MPILVKIGTVIKKVMTFKELLTTHNGRCVILKAHHEHGVLRSAKLNNHLSYKNLPSTKTFASDLDMAKIL